MGQLEAALLAPRKTFSQRLARTLQRRRRGVTGTTAVVALLIVWQVVGSQNIIGSQFISYPTEVLASGAAMVASGELGDALLVSLQEFLYGFVPAVVLGVALGVAMGLFRRLHYLLDPLMMALYTAPRIALVPVVVVWLGIGMESKIAIVFLSAFFPIVVNSVAGVQQVDPTWVRAAQSFGASRLQLVTKVILPAALPAQMAGVRLGVGRAIMGVIVGEMYVSIAGLGHLITLYSSAARAGEIFVLVVVISGFGFLCVTAMRYFEERVAPWRREMEL